MFRLKPDSFSFDVAFAGRSFACRDGSDDKGHAIEVQLPAGPVVLPWMQGLDSHRTTPATVEAMLAAFGSEEQALAFCDEVERQRDAVITCRLQAAVARRTASKEHK